MYDIRGLRCRNFSVSRQLPRSVCLRLQSRWPVPKLSALDMALDMAGAVVLAEALASEAEDLHPVDSDPRLSAAVFLAARR